MASNVAGPSRNSATRLPVETCAAPIRHNPCASDSRSTSMAEVIRDAEMVFPIERIFGADRRPEGSGTDRADANRRCRRRRTSAGGERSRQQPADQHPERGAKPGSLFLRRVHTALDAKLSILA